MTSAKLPKWPKRRDIGELPSSERVDAIIDYERARADAAMARLREAVGLLDELAQGDDWIQAAARRFHERIGPLPPLPEGEGCS